MHAVLASIDFKVDDTLPQSAAMNGRLLGATDDEIQTAIEVIRRALEHPVLKRAAAQMQHDLRRETPILLTLEDGSLAEGVIDLAYLTDDAEFAGWTVVDFKTDREFAASSQRYVAQVRLYAEAISKLMNAPVEGVLLVL